MASNSAYKELGFASGQWVKWYDDHGHYVGQVAERVRHGHLVRVSRYGYEYLVDSLDIIPIKEPKKLKVESPHSTLLLRERLGYIDRRRTRGDKVPQGVKFVVKNWIRPKERKKFK